MHYYQREDRKHKI